MKPQSSNNGRRLPRLAPQAVIGVAALALWAVLPRFELWSLVASYLVAWLALGWLLPRGRRVELPARRSLIALATAVVLAGPLAALMRERAVFLDGEEISGIGETIGDRARLEQRPAIAPSTIFCDHPQSLYVYAPGAADLRLQLGRASQQAIELTGSALGNGLFRVEYDPRRDGELPGDDRELTVGVVSDTGTTDRQLHVVCPQPHPRWFQSTPARGLAATVSEETDELFIVSRQGLAARVAVADGPSDAAFFAAGQRLAVSHRYSRDLWIVDVDSTAVVDRLDLGPFQQRLAVSTDDTRLAVAMGGLEPAIRIFDLPTLERRGVVHLDFTPDWLAFGPDADTLVVSSRETRALHRLERDSEGTWRQRRRLELGRPAVTLGRAPDGRHLYVAVTDYRPDGEVHRGNHFIQDQILTIDSDRWQITGQLLTARRSSRQSRPGNLDQGLSPMGISVRADGSLLVAFAGSDEVWHLDSELRRPPRIVTGADLDLVTPHGVADLGDGFWVASTPAGGALAIYDESDVMQTFVGVAPADAELAAAPPRSRTRHTLRLRAGERAFYEGTRAGLSCQSCHLHTDSDHSAHDIGQTPLLPTLTARGVAGTAPYLRDGSFARIEDLNDHLAGELYRGYRRDVPDRGQALAAFVAALPRHVNPRLLASRDLDLEHAGGRAFVDASCAHCHAFPAFTNLSQHPVRSLFPDYGAEQPASSRLDTPSLLGTHARTHLLQDGRAGSLAEVLDRHNRHQRHGDTAALSDAERAALIYFLEGL